MACAPLGIHVLFFLDVWRNMNRYTQYGIPCNTQHSDHSCHLNAFYNIAHCTTFNAAHDSHNTQFCMFHATHCTQSWRLVHSGTEHANQLLKIIHSFFFFFLSVAALLESQMDHLEAEVRLKVLRQRKSPASQRCHRASQRCHRASQRCHRVNTRWAAQTGQYHPPDSRPLMPLPRCRLTIPCLREQHHFSRLLQHDPHRHQPHTQSTSLRHLSCSWRTEWVVRWRAESRQCRHTAHPPIWWTRRFSFHHKEVSICRSLLCNSRHVLVAKLSSYTLPIGLDISDYELCHLFADISVRLLNLDKRLSLVHFIMPLNTLWTPIMPLYTLWTPYEHFIHLMNTLWTPYEHRSFLTYQLTMALHVETSWCPYQLFHRTLSINLTASIVSCQSCVVYTTFVGNSVLSFTTSKLKHFIMQICVRSYFFLSREEGGFAKMKDVALESTCELLKPSLRFLFFFVDFCSIQLTHRHWFCACRCVAEDHDRQQLI